MDSAKKSGGQPKDETWIPWARNINKPWRWVALLKYQFSSQADCDEWLKENFPLDDKPLTETISLPYGKRPVDR